MGITAPPSQFCCESKTFLKKNRIFTFKKGMEINLELSFNILNIFVIFVGNYLRDVFIHMKNGTTYPVNKILKASKVCISRCMEETLLCTHQYYFILLLVTLYLLFSLGSCGWVLWVKGMWAAVRISLKILLFSIYM